VPGGNPLPVTPAGKARRIHRTWLLIALVLTLAVGMVLGLALGSGWLGLEPRNAPATHPPATQPATPLVTSVVIRPTASSACLETARRADEIIQLLITNRRIRAAKLLVAYTVASRQCRRDAAPLTRAAPTGGDRVAGRSPLEGMRVARVWRVRAWGGVATIAHG
jgi:hypothetical protein